VFSSVLSIQNQHRLGIGRGWERAPSRGPAIVIAVNGIGLLMLVTKFWEPGEASSFANMITTKTFAWGPLSF